jgi:hypothetical protein
MKNTSSMFRISEVGRQYVHLAMLMLAEFLITIGYALFWTPIALVWIVYTLVCAQFKFKSTVYSTFINIESNRSNDPFIVEEDCCICLSPLTNEIICLRGCHHQFHLDCIRKWCSISSSCPLCQCKIQQ